MSQHLANSEVARRQCGGLGSRGGGHHSLLQDGTVEYPAAGRRVDVKQFEVHVLGGLVEFGQHLAGGVELAPRSAEPHVVHPGDGHGVGEQCPQPVGVEAPDEQLVRNLADTRGRVPAGEQMD